MRDHSSELLEVLTGSFSRRLYVDVFHGTDRVLEDLPVTGWTFEGDLDGEIKHSGRGTIAYSSESGESLVPEGTTGILSPFRARLYMILEVFTDDGFSERIGLGWMQVTNVPSARDMFATVNGVEQVVSSYVEIVFESLELKTWRRGFRYPEDPASYASCYGELRRITTMPVTESVPDVPVPAGLQYAAERGGRLKAVQSLAAALKGRAVVDPAGAWTIVPNVPGAVVGELRVGTDGTVTDVGYEVSTEGVCNVVVGTFEDANRNPVTSVAVAPPGDLAVDGLFGEYTEYYTPNIIASKALADTLTAERLAQNISSQQYEVPIQCVLNPLLELGDVLELVGHSRPLTGRVVKYTLSDSPQMNVTLAEERAL